MLAVLSLLLTVAAWADGPERMLIPEIVDAPSGATLNSEIFQRYDSRAIGESLVERLRRLGGADSALTSDAPPEYDYLRDSEIQIYFKKEHIPAILKDGYLNQHEVPSTTGAYSPENRAVREDALIGLKLEAQYSTGSGNPVNRVRPKYAMFSLTAPNGFPVLGGSYYGDMVAVLRPEVKYRSTWTPTDSLATRQVRTPFFRKGALSFAPPDRGGPYVEAQIWGAVELRDIQEFRVPAGFPADSLATLKKAGLPIYTYSEKQTWQPIPHYDRTRGQLLYKGDPAKMAEYEKSATLCPRAFANLLK